MISGLSNYHLMLEIDVVHSLLNILLSRNPGWWGRDWNWIIILLFLALRYEQDQALKASIGYILPPLVDAYKKLAPLFAGFQVGSELVI